MICLKSLSAILSFTMFVKIKRSLVAVLKKGLKKLTNAKNLVTGNAIWSCAIKLALSERMSRECLIICIPDKTSASVMQDFERLQRQYSEHWNDIFKTITTDNGSEFADLSNLEKVSNTLVYYAHPYTFCYKDTMVSFADSFLKVTKLFLTTTNH